MTDHEPPPDDLPEDPTDWDLDERDEWLAEDHEGETAPVEVVVDDDE